MKVLKRINAFPRSKRTVVTLGNFDGVHTGHRRIIGEAVRRAKAMGGQSVVITFVPHTQALQAVGRGCKVLTTPEEKARILRGLGVDFLVFVRFTRALRAMTAAAFLQHRVFGPLRPGAILFGYDHRFGRGRTGDDALIRRLCARRGVKAVKIRPVVVQGKIVSSTLIRELVKMGKVEAAAGLLAAPYLIIGRIGRGDRRGRTLGFPTANLDVAPEKRLPPDGVYYGSAAVGGRSFRAVVSLGTRPTFGGGSRMLETYLLDYTGDLYGRKMALSLHGFLRPQRRCRSTAALKRLIAADVRAVEKIMKVQ